METKELEKLFRAFANRRRIEIVRLLMREGPMSIKDIAPTLKISYKVAFQHAAFLEQRGILDKERKGGEVLYFLAKDIGKVSETVVGLVKRA